MSKIEWTEKSWNPIIGCSKVSAGCKNCYAERMANRLAWMGNTDYLKVVGPLAYMTNWNGNTHFVESALSIPLKRKKATTYFVCSMSDIFHPSVKFEWIDKVFAVMWQCGQHTFQVLTKRPERMAEYLSPDNDRYTARKIADLLPDGFPGTFDADMYWPLDNVILGTTAENQEMADKRIPELLKCPAAKRFVSIEPMLGPVNFRWRPYHHQATGETYREYLTRKGSIDEHESLKMLDWVICGGESGPGARPMHPDWARSIHDQCKAAGVPFFFKQWGEWLPLGQGGSAAGSWMDNSHRSKEGEPMYKVTDGYDNLIGTGISHHFDNLGQTTYRIGKKKAGCLLDGAEHKEYPK